MAYDQAAADWQHHANDLASRIASAMSIKPEDHATKSRDYGRGFAEAIRLVHEALSGAKGH